MISFTHSMAKHVPTSPHIPTKWIWFLKTSIWRPSRPIPCRIRRPCICIVHEREKWCKGRLFVGNLSGFWVWLHCGGSSAFSTSFHPTLANRIRGAPLSHNLLQALTLNLTLTPAMASIYTSIAFPPCSMKIYCHPLAMRWCAINTSMVGLDPN